jgi:hypothetical protein
MSRVRVYVTNNNGFKIGWLDLLALLVQLHLITITYNSSQSVPFLPRSRASTLPLWLTCTNDVLRMNYVSFYNLVRTGNRALPWTVRLLYSACVNSAATARCHGYALSETPPSNGPLRLSGFLTHSLSCKRGSTPQQPCVSEPLSSNGRPFRLHYSGFQPSCHCS